MVSRKSRRVGSSSDQILPKPGQAPYPAAKWRRRICIAMNQSGLHACTNLADIELEE